MRFRSTVKLALAVLMLGVTATLISLGAIAQTRPADTSDRVIAPPAPEAGAARRPALRFLTDSDYPPFNYIDQDGQLAGFNVEIARAICLELAAVCEIKARPWSELLVALKRKEVDAVIASHAVTPRLLSEFDVSDRYYQMPARFAGRVGRAFPDVSPSGLDGLKIAVAKGTAHEAYVRALFTLSAIHTYDNPELARDALISGVDDLLFDDGISLAFWLLGTTSKACCEFKGGPYFEPRYFGDGVGVVINRNDPELKQQLNTAIRRLRDSGRQEELIGRSFPLRAN